MLRAKKRKLFCCYVDLSAAFDNVSRAFLWRKLLSQGITGKFLNVVQNLYKNIKSCVACENHKMFSFFECTKGVRQGENLSPILFSLYLNDLESFLEQNQSQGVNTDLNFETESKTYLKILILHYADDTVLLAESREELQLTINNFK